jgi:hypothetical protein
LFVNVRLSAHLVYPAKVTDLKPKVEQGKVKAAPQKPFASSYYRVAPKQEEVAIRKVNIQVPAKKVSHAALLLSVSVTKKHVYKANLLTRSISCSNW